MMPDFFANPAGFFGLLAVPAILVIHMLREKSRRLPVSTLFLLDRLAPRTPSGRTLHVLQNSLPMWLQILAALLITWLLVDPRWVRADSTQRVTVILDSSASMQAAQPRLRELLPEVLARIAKASARTDWAILTSHAPESPLYRGSDVGGVMAALEGWQPTRPHHDPARAFALALLDARESTVLYVTDRKPETLPAGIQLLAGGAPLENCGFVGQKTWRDASGPQWQALVKASGEKAQERTWWFETEKVRSQVQTLRLEPGQIATIAGPFPPGETQVRVMLSADEFPLDDVLPLVATEPKPLGVFVAGNPAMSQLAERIVVTVAGARRVNTPAEADLAIVASTDALAASFPGAKVIFGSQGATPGNVRAPIAAEKHPLTDGLVWDGLLLSGIGSLAMEGGDQALVWQRQEALIFLRTAAGKKQLFLNFEVEKSNADRLPSFVLLLSRFLASVQSDKPVSFAENFETHQLLPLSGAGLTMAREKATEEVFGEVHAPSTPGFFRVLRGKEMLLWGGAHFADAQEADFRAAGTILPDLARAAAVRRENTVGDPFALGWTALLTAALIGSWAVLGRGARA